MKVSKEELQKLGIKDTREFNYFRVENSAIDSQKLKGVYQIAVYTALCRYGNSEGYCYPSLITLCNALDISKNKLLKTLKELEDSGVISKKTRKNGKANLVNIYVLSGIKKEKEGSACGELGSSSDDFSGSPYELGSSPNEPKEETIIKKQEKENKGDFDDLEKIRQRIFKICLDNKYHHKQLHKISSAAYKFNTKQDLLGLEKRIINGELKF